MNTAQLLDQLQLTLNTIDEQIEVVTDRHEEYREISGHNLPSIEKMVNPKGQPVLMDLTIAKANVLLAMTNLQLADQAVARTEDSEGASTSTDGTLSVSGLAIHEQNAVEVTDAFCLDWSEVQHKLDLARRLHKRLFYYQSLDTLKLI